MEADTKTNVNNDQTNKKLSTGSGQEVIVMTIKLKGKVIEATFREHNCNIPHLVELISLHGDFKNFPKKFKEIFQNYVKTEFNNATTNNKIQIIPPSSTLTTNTGGFSI